MVIYAVVAARIAFGTVVALRFSLAGYGVGQGGAGVGQAQEALMLRNGELIVLDAPFVDCVRVEIEVRAYAYLIEECSLYSAHTLSALLPELQVTSHAVPVRRGLHGCIAQP